MDHSKTAEDAPFAPGPFLGLGAVAVLVATLVYANWNNWAVDFSALYFAGHFFAEGDLAQIYAAPEHVIGDQIPPAWAAASAAMGFGPGSDKLMASPC